MRKIGIISSLVFLTTVVAHSQMLKGDVDSLYLPSLKMHYQDEYTFDKPVDQHAWNNAAKGLNVSFASTERSYFRTEVPSKTDGLNWSATGWKGEKLDEEILVWSADTLEQVRFQFSDLSNGHG